MDYQAMDYHVGFHHFVAFQADCSDAVDVDVQLCHTNNKTLDGKEGSASDTQEHPKLKTPPSLANI